MLISHGLRSPLLGGERGPFWHTPDLSATPRWGRGVSIPSVVLSARTNSDGERDLGEVRTHRVHRGLQRLEPTVEP